MSNKKGLSWMITIVCALVLCLAGCRRQAGGAVTETMTETMTVTMTEAMTLEKRAAADPEIKTQLEKTLEDDPEIRAQLEKTMEELPDDLIKYSITFEENCMVVTGTLGIKYSEYDIAATEKTFEAISQQNAEPQLEMIGELTGLSGITVRFVFLDAEGTELFNREYGKSE